MDPVGHSNRPTNSSVVYNNLRKSASFRLKDFIRHQVTKKQSSASFLYAQKDENYPTKTNQLNSTVLSTDESPSPALIFPTNRDSDTSSNQHFICPQNMDQNESKYSKTRLEAPSQIRSRTIEHIQSFISNLTNQRALLDDDLLQLISRKLNISAATAVPFSRPLPSLWPQLSGPMEKLIDTCCLGQSGVVSSAFGIEISVEDIDTLRPNNWLNNDVINFYLHLINARSSEYKANRGVSRHLLALTYCFNTFFYAKLCSNGFNGVRRWTKRQNIDIFSLELLLIPLHLSIHWCLVAVDFVRQKINYYDSLAGMDSVNSIKILNMILDYLEDEFTDKKPPNYIFDRSAWDLSVPSINPQQRNGNDCGVFLCTNAELLSRCRSLLYSQTDIQFVRRKVIYEIVTKNLFF